MSGNTVGLRSIITENRKVLYFLMRFLGVFGGFSLLYGYWIDHYGVEADPASWFVGRNLQALFGADLALEAISGHQAISVIYQGHEAVSLYEGCNGIAVMILFFAFVFAFKGRWMDLLWFVPVGLAVIHAFNLLRLSVLIHLSQRHSELFHFVHKYLFTLIIYAAVFVLWVIWVRMALKRNRDARA